jgi:glycosyltransferase involved in cell wall biosynthesis
MQIGERSGDDSLGRVTPTADRALLNVVMPVFNERATVAEAIDAVLGVELPAVAIRLVVVESNSTDGSREIVERYADHPRVTVVLQDEPRGKGYAVREGFRHVDGGIILIQDADLEYDPRDYPLLLEPILEDQADVVFGNRFHGGPHRVLYFWHYAANRMLTFVTNVLTGLNLSDMEVGYKVFRAEVLQRIALKSDRFGFEPEITIKVARLGLRIYEVPIRYYGRTYAEGKKITWRDGVAAIGHIIRHRFFD